MIRLERTLLLVQSQGVACILVGVEIRVQVHKMYHPPALHKNLAPQEHEASGAIK